MNILIVCALVLLIAVEIMSLINSILVNKENEQVYRSGLQILREENNILKNQLHESQEVSTLLLSSKGFSKTAFAITPDGVKILPEDWHEKCFQKKKK